MNKQIVKTSQKPLIGLLVGWCHLVIDWLVGCPPDGEGVRFLKYLTWLVGWLLKSGV